MVCRVTTDLLSEENLNSLVIARAFRRGLLQNYSNFQRAITELFKFSNFYDHWSVAVLTVTVHFIYSLFFSNWLLSALNSICLLHLFCFPL